MKLIKRYGFIGASKLLVSLIYTKLFFSNARLIRLPFDIRNKKNIKIGASFTTGFGCRLEAFPIDEKYEDCLIIGKNVELNDYVHIAAGEKVIIGSNVLIASKVFISDINHGVYSGDNPDSPLSMPNDRKLSTKPVIIHDRVWIGESVCIMAGVTIGEGSIIGAGSVVTKSIPEFSIAVGSPAKVVKVYDFTSNIWIKI